MKKPHTDGENHHQSNLGQSLSERGRKLETIPMLGTRHLSNLECNNPRI